MDDCTGSLTILTSPASNTHNRPLPGRGSKSARRTRNYIIRAAAKRYALSNEQVNCRELGVDCSQQQHLDLAAHKLGDHKACSDPANRRQHFEKSLGFFYDTHLKFDPSFPHPKQSKPAGTRRRKGLGWTPSEVAEGHDLARSQISLPSDRARLVRRPTLEREEAFRDASTSRGNVRLRPAIPLIPGDEDAQVAELYRMGLLYDEGDQHGAFDLNSISHNEPVYSVRPAKRARKLNKARGYDEPLHLDLSFTDLGHDTAISELLLSPSPSEAAATEESESSMTRSRKSSQSSAPLRVIYELESSAPSYDVDTSQPPDLIDDDYDLFSESEFDDLPSQREVHDSAANPPSDAWIMLGDDS